MIEVLGAEHWRAMGRLRASCNTHAGVSVRNFTNAAITTVGPQYRVPPNRAVGYFDENKKLTAFICAYGGDNFWVLDLMVASGDPRHLQECLEDMLQHYESQGITQFFYAFPNKWARAYRSFWKAGAPSLRKYTIQDVEILAANKRPANEWVWQNVLHEVIVPVPLLLRRSYVE